MEDVEGGGGVGLVKPGEIAYLVTLEKFVFQKDGAWNQDEPVGKEGIKNHLLAGGWSLKDARTFLNEGSYLKVYGFEMAPGEKPLFEAPDGKVYLNTWTPPTLTAAPGEYPTIQRVLNWIIVDEAGKPDVEGQRYLRHWMAAKVQNPSYVPKNAIVMSTAQGGGKGFIAFLLRQMLGPKNTAVIKQEEIENRFNARWVQKLFVLGDEVLSNDKIKDISNKLKVLIDGNELELEGKHQNQRAVKSRLAWMFASNDTVSPLMLEKTDRRYTVFTNHRKLEPEYTKALNACFKADRETPTEEFTKEMQAFYHELLETKVDFDLIRRPYHNDSRTELISANAPAHEMFFDHVEEHGIDDLLTTLVDLRDFTLAKTRHEWDFGTGGLSVAMLYQCYREFCRRIGAHELRINRFGHALRNARPHWKAIRKSVPKTARQVLCYVVPRAPAPAKEVVDAPN